MSKTITNCKLLCFVTMLISQPALAERQSDNGLGGYYQQLQREALKTIIEKLEIAAVERRLKGLAKAASTAVIPEIKQSILRMR